MRKQLALTAALASILFISGCANMDGMSDTTRRTATGAGVGALGGAAIGATASGRTAGCRGRATGTRGNGEDRTGGECHEHSTLGLAGHQTSLLCGGVAR